MPYYKAVIFCDNEIIMVRFAEKSLGVAILCSVIIVLLVYLYGSDFKNFKFVGHKGDSIRPEPVQRKAHALRSDKRDGSVLFNQAMAAKLKPPLIKTRCIKKLPRALVIGVKKGGTGAIRFFMGSHPSIAFAPKEIQVFNGLHMEHNLNYYRKQMKCSTPGQLTMEASPGYFPSLFAPQRIKEMLPGVKLILLLRDPVSRAISDYVHTIETGRLYEPIFCPTAAALAETKTGAKRKHVPSFKECVQYQNGSFVTHSLLLATSRYVDFLPRWLEHFPRQRILILDGSAFAKDPFPAVKQMEEFLEIPAYFNRSNFEFQEEKGFYCLHLPSGQTCLGKSKGRPHPTVNETFLHILYNYFEPFNKKLNAMLNRTFLWST